MKRHKAFLISFCLGFLTLGAPYAAAFYSVTAGKSPAKQEESVEAGEPVQGMTFLFSAAEKGETPRSFLLLRFRFSERCISYAVLPGETMVETSGGFDSLALVWRNAGGRAAADALACTAGIPVDRYMTVPRDPLVETLNQIGTIDMTLTGKDGVLPAGRQVLDGSSIVELAFSRSYAGGEEARLAAISALVGEVISQRAALLRTADLEKIYLIAVNAGKNDLTAADYELQREALENLFKEEVLSKETVAAGSYNESGNTFLLSTQTLQDFSENFS